MADYIPTDIWLRVVAFLAPEDGIALTQVSQMHRELVEMKSFWLELLNGMNSVRAMPFPPNLDLYSLETEQLKSLALHSARLKTNWSLLRPRLLRAPKITFLNTPSGVHLTFIPGTPLVVTTSGPYSQNIIDQEIACWNMDSGTAQATRICSTRVPGSVLVATEPLFVPEGVSLCLYISRGEERYYEVELNIRFEAGSYSDTTMTSSVVRPMPVPGWRGLHGAMSDEMSVWVFQTLFGMWNLKILARHRKTGRILTILTDPPNSGLYRFFLLTFRARCLYIVYCPIKPDASDVQPCPTICYIPEDVLPYTTSSSSSDEIHFDLSATCVDYPWPGVNPEAEKFNLCYATITLRGVLSIGYHVTHASVRAVRAFWHLPLGPPDGVLPLAGMHSLTLPPNRAKFVRACDSTLLWTKERRRKVAQCLNHLTMFRYDMYDGSVSSHKLVLPLKISDRNSDGELTWSQPVVDGTSPFNITLDEGLGIVRIPLRSMGSVVINSLIYA